MSIHKKMLTAFSRSFIGLCLAVSVSASHAAIVYLGGTSSYEDGSASTTAVPDMLVIVPDNDSFAFACGLFGGDSCEATVSAFTTWTDNTYGDVILTGVFVSFDVVDNVIENYEFAFAGVDALTQLVEITADAFQTCRSVGTCSPWIPGEPNYYEIGEVPLPAAFWLFGSAVLGLMGCARGRRSV